MSHLRKVNRFLTRREEAIFGEVHLTSESAESAIKVLQQQNPKGEFYYRYDLVERLYRVYTIVYPKS